MKKSLILVYICKHIYLKGIFYSTYSTTTMHVLVDIYQIEPTSKDILKKFEFEEWGKQTSIERKS